MFVITKLSAMKKNPIKTKTWLIILILFTCTALLISGLNSELHLGDEVHHYRFAKDMYNSGERPSFDHAYETGFAPGYFYNGDPLWSTGLAVIWKVIGGIYFPVAQLYHTFYFVVLVLASYLVAKELYSEKTALFAAIIVSTIPMVVAFSILFYADIPITALSVLCFLLVLKRSYLYAGIVFGLMYLTKRNGCFFLPILMVLVFWGQKDFRLGKRIKSLLFFLLPAILIIYADVSWKRTHLPLPPLDAGTIEGIWDRATFKIRNPASKYSNDVPGAKKLGEAKKVEYLNSSLANPIDIVKYMGIALLGISVFSLFHIKRSLSRKELILVLAIITYLGFYCLFFRFSSDIRYICPIVPFIAILASRYIELFDRRWVKITFLLVCFSQLAFTVGYVNTRRKIPPSIKEVFSYITENIPEEALILYPELNIMEATNRRMIWSSFGQIERFFWAEDGEWMKHNAEFGEIEYIVLKKSRVYVKCNLCKNNDTELLFSKKEKFGITSDNFAVVRCKVCGLVYINPRPSKAEIAKFYPETYSWKETLMAGSKITKIIRKLEKAYRYHLLNYEVSKVIKEAKIRTGRLLDVGCGSGNRLNIFRESGFETYGVEISQYAEYARDRLGLKVTQGDLFDAQFPDAFFDIITLHNVLEHTHDPQSVIKELHRILKEDGIIVVQVPNIDCLQFKLFKKRWAAMDIPRDLYYFNVSLLENAMGKGRFAVKKVDHFNNWWHPPTLVISIWPALDPQFSWRTEASKANSYFRRVFWGLMTLIVSPLTKLESLMGKGAIITIYARKIS